MNEKQIRELLHGATDGSIRRIAEHPASDAQQKQRIYQRVLGSQDPGEPAVSETYQVQEAGRTPWRRTAAIGLAACLVFGLGIGAVVGIQRMTPRLTPGNVVEETEAAAVCTPFGDITKTKPLFQYTSGNTREAEQLLRDNGNPDAHMLEERTLTQEQLEALGEVFRVYGWRDQVNTQNPDSTITDDCIVMHLYQNPESRANEYLTAYFQLDTGDTEHLVRVDSNGETMWYYLDDEIIRCLREIVIDGQTAEYPPQKPDFGEHFLHQAVYHETEDNWTEGQYQDITLTDSQLAALSGLLDRAPFYEWNIIRELNPIHGRNIQIPISTDEGQNAWLIFWLNTGCVQIKSQNVHHGSPSDVVVYGSSTSYFDYWVDDTYFMQEVELLLREGIYPVCPVDLMQAQDLAFQQDPAHVMPNETYSVSQVQVNEHARLNALFSSITWKEIACPVDPDTFDGYEDFCLHYTDGNAYQLRFSSAGGFMEWTAFSAPDAVTGEELPTGTFYFELKQEDWAMICDIHDTVCESAKQPFLNLGFSSWRQTCYIDSHGVVVGELNRRFDVELPPNDTEFTFDTIRMQELFDTLDWTPQNIPAENWKPGYVRMQLSPSASLLVSITGYDDPEHYLLRYEGSTGEPLYYFADEAFIREFMQILSETGEVVTSEINIVSMTPFGNLIEEEPLYCGMGDSHPLDAEERSILLEVLYSMDWTARQPWEEDVIPDEEFILISVGAPAGMEESTGMKAELFFCPSSARMVYVAFDGSPCESLQCPITDENYRPFTHTLAKQLYPVADCARAYLESIETDAKDNYMNWDAPWITTVIALPDAGHILVNEPGPDVTTIYSVTFYPVDETERTMLGVQILYLAPDGTVLAVGVRD